MKELDFLKESHNRLTEYSKELRFDKNHPFHLTLIKLHGSIIELCSSIVILLENMGQIGIPSIFRTLTETFVEFKNLSNDRKYGYYLEATNLKQSLMVMKEAKRGGNPFLNEIGMTPELDNHIMIAEEKLEELKNKGYTPLRILKKFEMADMEDVYRSIYNFLSTDSHSNIGALIDRHIDIDFEKLDFEVVFYKNEPVEKYFAYVDSATSFLIESGLIIHELLDSPKNEQIKELKIEFNKLRQNKIQLF